MTSTHGALTSLKLEHSAVIGLWHVSPIKSFRYEKRNKIFFQKNKTENSHARNVENRFNFFFLVPKNNFPFSHIFYLLSVLPLNLETKEKSLLKIHFHKLLKQHTIFLMRLLNFVERMNNGWQLVVVRKESKFNWKVRVKTFIWCWFKTLGLLSILFEIDNAEKWAICNRKLVIFINKRAILIFHWAMK